MSKSATKILTTAEELFNKNSFTSVGVDLIRDKSGCSKTTMYTYFKNKQHLVSEVLKQRDLRFRKSLIEHVNGSTEIDALEKIYDWHIQWFQADHFKGCLFVRAVAESSANETEIIHISMEHKIWLRQFIHEQIYTIENSESITELFFIQLEGMINLFLVEGFNALIADRTKNTLFYCIKIIQNKNI